MNIYDTKQICCSHCKSWVGEISYDAEIIQIKCGKCANPLPEGDDILYTINRIKNNNKEILVTV